MTKQITVRLPDDIVSFIDHMVEEGDASSRAAVVSRAVARERRRDLAEQDARILSKSASDDDLDDLAKYVVRMPPDIA